MKEISTSGNEHIYLCPFPGCDDEDGHLYLNKIKGVYNCFKCGRAGQISDLKDKIDILIDVAPDLLEILSTLENFTNGNYKRLALPDDYKIAHPKSRAAIYLRARGVSQEKIEKYRIGYTAQDGFRRIWFPDFNDQGELLFYTTRRYWRDDEKYDKGLRWEFPKSSVYGAWKSSQLYHYHMAKHHSRVYVVEGISSAISIGDNTVATYGTGYSEGQVYMIADMPCDEIYIIFDGDVLTEDQKRKGVKKGREKGRELSRAVAVTGKPTYRVDLPDNKDPNDVGKKKLAECIDNAVRVEQEAPLDDLVSRKVRKGPKKTSKGGK